MIDNPADELNSQLNEVLFSPLRFLLHAAGEQEGSSDLFGIANG